MAFFGNSSLTSISLPASLTSIGSNAFRDCSSLISVTLPEDAELTSISASAFNGCSSLISVTLPENAELTSIGLWAFSDCSSLTSITLPASLTSIYTFAFSGCDCLQTVVFEGNDVTFEDIGTFPGDFDGTSLRAAYQADKDDSNEGVAGAYTRDATGSYSGSWSRQ
jgi:hypothetical protein